MEVAATTDHRVRVMVVDDHRLVREGLMRLLDADSRLEVVGCLGTEPDSAEELGNVTPEVVLIDVHGFGDHTTTVSMLKQRWPDARMLVLLEQVRDADVVELLKCGTHGYMLKTAAPDTLVEGILAARRGAVILEPELAQRLALLAEGRGSGHQRPRDGLTPRELEMLTLLGRGCSPKSIAHDLKISPKTVRNHISHIYQKIGVFERTQAVRYAIKLGLATID